MIEILNSIRCDEKCYELTSRMISQMIWFSKILCSRESKIKVTYIGKEGLVCFTQNEFDNFKHVNLQIYSN